jgi:thiamine biosynthesis lipoprotein
MPLEQGRAFIDRVEGAEACWVMKDGSIVYSAGFQEYIKAD